MPSRCKTNQHSFSRKFVSKGIYLFMSDTKIVQYFISTNGLCIYRCEDICAKCGFLLIPIQSEMDSINFENSKVKRL